MSNLSIINISGVECYEKDGIVYLKLETAARELGFTQTAASGNKVVRWERVKRYLTELGFLTSGDTKALPEFIPENIFYRLAIKAKNKTAKKFQARVANEIIPSLRRTGSYAAVPHGKELLALAVLEAQRTLAALESDSQTSIEIPSHSFPN